MAVKLHRCSFGWLQFDICSRVQNALDDMGIEYEVVVAPDLAPEAAGHRSSCRVRSTTP